MKRLIMAALVGCVLAAMSSCEKLEMPAHGDDTVAGSGTVVTDESRTKEFTFHVKGDFATKYVDMTRAAVRLEDNNEAGVTDLWVLDYVNAGTDDAPQWKLVQMVHQGSAQEGITFGKVPMTLTYGHHEVRFVASRGDGPVLSAVTGSVVSDDAPHSLVWSKVKDTFVLSCPVDVSNASNGNRAPELKRAVGCITIINTDGVPANAKEMRVTLGQRYGVLSLPGLVGGGAVEFTNVFGFGDDDAGVRNLELNTYTLCPSESFAVDVAVKVIGKDNSVLSEFAMDGVDVKVNRRTVLEGECFNRAGGFSVAINDGWDQPLKVEL